MCNLVFGPLKDSPKIQCPLYKSPSKKENDGFSLVNYNNWPRWSLLFIGQV